MARKKTSKVNKAINVVGPTRLIPSDNWIKLDAFSNANVDMMRTPYSTHAFVYGCIRAIATNIAQVPLLVQSGPAKNPKTFDVTSPGVVGDIARVFAHPNLQCSAHELWELTTIHLNLCGDAFWVLDRDNISQVPKSIWVFGRKNFQPVMTEIEGTPVIIGWEFTSDQGAKYFLTLAEVCHFRFANPYDPIMGLAPIVAASRGVKFDLLAGDYSSAFFSNSAEPSGVISTERGLKDKQVQEIRESWESRHRGPGNAKKVGVLWGGMKYQPIFVSNKDMEFIEQRKWTLQELLAVFKVPKSELSMYEDVNYATSMAQSRSFWEKTLIPIQKNILSVIDTWIIQYLRPLVDQSLRVSFDLKLVPALQTHLNEKITNAKELATLGWPINAINEVLELGMPKVAWGDTWYVNQSMVPIEFVLEGKTLSKPSAPGEDKPEDSKPAGDDTNKPEDSPSDSESPKSMKIARLRAASAYLKHNVSAPLADVEETAEALIPVFKTFLYRLRAHQLARTIRGKGAFDTREWAERLSKKIMLDVQAFCGRYGKSVKSELVGKNVVEEIQTYLVTLGGDSDSVRDLFNQLTNKSNLLVLAKKELIGAIQGAEDVKAVNC